MSIKIKMTRMRRGAFSTFQQKIHIDDCIGRLYTDRYRSSPAWNILFFMVWFFDIRPLSSWLSSIPEYSPLLRPMSNLILCNPGVWGLGFGVWGLGFGRSEDVV